jgi:hypothetical protein
MDRWLSLRGPVGPLGCPLSDATTPPGGAAGQVQTFEHGQIGLVSWPGATKMTVAAYQAQSDVVVEWGDTDPYHYDKFNVIWRKDGFDLEPQNSVAGQRRGLDHVRGVGPGAYTVQVEGCDTGVTDSCVQGFTFPLTVNVTAPSSYNTDCSPMPTGIIGDRWSRIWTKLGCPLGAEQPYGNGKVQTFQFGQIVWSPDQGSDLTVALYLNGDQLGIEWGDTFPYNYDKFIVDVNGQEADVTLQGASHLTALSASYPFDSTPLSPGSTYTVKLEGCDTPTVGPSQCMQRWTLPVSVTFNPQPLLSTMPGIDFTALHPAATAADIGTELTQRTLAIDNNNACYKTLVDMYKDEQDFSNGALAKLDLLSRNVFICSPPYPAAFPKRPRLLKDEVNSALRFLQVKSGTGTGCTSRGEYDVALSGLTAMVYKYGQFEHGPFLEEDVREHIVYDLLNARGPALNSEFTYCSVVPETENHLNQIEAGRYLTNQILYRWSGDQFYNNEANGMNDFMLARLQRFLKQDFVEYNSRPYQTYTANAMQNLYDYATDRRVKMAARLVLDFLSAKFAISSNTLRRSAPYRRRVSDYEDDLFGQHADPWSPRMAMMTGMVTSVPIGSYADFAPKFSFGWNVDMQEQAITSYRAPDSVVDFIMDPTRRSYFQRIHHDGVEIYASRPEYLITAGGFPTPPAYTVAGFGASDDSGVVVATTLMPTGADRSVTDLIRFEGVDWADKGRMARLNTCVAPDFACGVGMRIPLAYMKPGCHHEEGNTPQQWVFIDAASPGCTDPRHTSKFYVAAYIDGDPANYNAGFFEARPYDGTDFQTFWTNVHNNNAGRTFAFDPQQPDSYVMSSGRVVQFKAGANADYKEQWSIVSTGDAGLDALGNDISKWPLATGDAFTAGGDGIVRFVNAKQGSSLTLDYTDSEEPKRVVVGPPPPAPPHKCPTGTHDCGDGICIPKYRLCM